jgi:propanol-preferring alcohol dehydrogenase
LHGGHADFVLIPEKDCLPLPDNLSYAVGSVIPDGVGVPYHLLRRMGGVSGLDTVAVFGAGPIGLGMVAMLKYMGTQQIIVSELSAYRRELAEKLGADRTIDPQAEDPVEVILSLTGGIGVDKAIDAASYTDVTTNQALTSVKKGGTVGLVGQKDSATIEEYTHQLIHKELYVVSSCGYNLSEYESLVAAVQGGLNAKGLVTHEYPLEEIQTAFEVFDSGNTGKVVISRQ